MSQELLYNVRFKEDAGDIKRIQKELENLKKPSGKKDSGARDQKEFNTSLKEANKALKDKETTLKQLRNSLKGYKDDLADVQREVREQGTATEANVRKQRDLGNQIAETKTQIESATRGNLDYDTSLTQSGNNLREMKGQLRAFKVAIEEVEDPLGKGADEIKSLTERHDELNTTIGNVEKQMGVHTRNVGNYTESIHAAANAVAIWQGPLGPIAGRINAAGTAISRFRQANDAATKSTIKLTTAVKLLMLGTGIGALIVALTSLIAFFKRTEEGQQKLRVITAGFTAVLETLADRASALGKTIFEAGQAMVEAFRSPQVSLARLYVAVGNFRKFFVESLIERARAVPEFWLGILNQVVGSFQWTAAKIKLALSDVPILGRGVDTEKAENDLREANKRIVEGFEKTAGALKTMYGTEFFGDLFGGALEATKKLFSDVSDNMKGNIRNQKEMNDILVRERDLLVDRAEMERDTARAREDSRNLDIDAEKRLEALLEVRGKEEALLKEELKLERDRLKVMEEQNDRFDSTEEDLRELAEQQAKIFNLEETHAKTMMSLTRDQVAVERQIREQDMREARVAFEEREGLRNLALEQQAQRLEDIGNMLEAERIRQQESDEDALERKNLRIAQLEAEFLNQRFGEKRAAELAQTQFEIEEGKRRLEASKRLKDLEFQAEQRKLQTISGLMSSFNQAFFNDSKELAIASTIIDTYAGIQKALKDGGPNLFTRIAGAAIVAAQGVANVRKIMSTNLGSKSVDSGGSQAQPPSTSFGFVDLPSMGSEMASQQSPSQDYSPNIILEGEFDPEFLSVKVRQGNNTISGNTIGIGA